MKIIPKSKTDVTLRLRALYLKAEQDIINEITRKRKNGLIDYADVASLERVQKILTEMTDKAWTYVPQMVDKIIQSPKDTAGYGNAEALTATQTAVSEQLVNILGELTEAAETAFTSVRELYVIGRQEADRYRKAALETVAQQEAEGAAQVAASAAMQRELIRHGITAFVDKAGRRWTLRDYCDMCTRTTARQAQVSAVLTADDEQDLYQIVKIGSTCPVCAPLEGRVYSKSGTNPDYPPLAAAFGKVDPLGADDLTNTYLNIHPNCLHSLIPYTTIGKSEKQIEKDKEFSSFTKNPVTRDPRTKKQIKAYREKEKNRRQLLADIKQWKRYRAELGNKVSGDIQRFREMKYNQPEKWTELKEKYKLTLQENEYRMEAREMGTELESQRYGRNKETLINNTYVDGGEYRRKFDKITAKPDVNRVLYQKAKEMLKHRSGTLTEDMYWIDADTGEVVAKVIDQEESIEEKVIYPVKVRKAIKGRKNLIAMHTHPASMPPSLGDLISAYNNNYKNAYIVCHDGTLYRYKSNERIRESLYKLYYEQYKEEGYSEHGAQTQTIKELMRSFDIEFEEVF